MPANITTKTTRGLTGPKLATEVKVDGVLVGWVYPSAARWAKGYQPWTVEGKALEDQPRLKDAVWELASYVTSALRSKPATAIPAETSVGYPILAAYPTPANGANRAGWIVLCDISRDNEDDPFATWWMDEDGHPSEGHYYSERASACRDFARRVAREVGERLVFDQS